MGDAPRRISSYAFALALILAVLPLAAHADHHEAEGAPEMSAEEQAMMQAWEKAMTPGDEHAWLADKAGDYKMEIKMWMGPGEPMVSEGTAHSEMIMGGRILRETVEGTVMGQPFNGEGLTGYDNVTGRWWGTWVDNMGTAAAVSWGDRDGDTLNMDSEYPDPMTGEMKTTRMAITYGDGGMVMEAFQDMDGEEMKMMEITYTPL